MTAATTEQLPEIKHWGWVGHMKIHGSHRVEESKTHFLRPERSRNLRKMTLTTTVGFTEVVIYCSENKKDNADSDTVLQFICITAISLYNIRDQKVSYFSLPIAIAVSWR